MPYPEQVRLLVESIAMCLVDDCGKVEVTIVERGDTTIIRIVVAQGDSGMVIGKQGRTARCIRTILGAVSAKTNHRFQLDICENPKHT